MAVHIAVNPAVSIINVIMAAIIVIIIIIIIINVVVITDFSPSFFLFSFPPSPPSPPTQSQTSTFILPLKILPKPVGLTQREKERQAERRKTEQSGCTNTSA